MANIIGIEPVRYTQDGVISEVKGLIKVKDSAPIDLTKYNRIQKLTITTDPSTLPSSVECRLAFKTEGGLWSRCEVVKEMKPDGSIADIIIELTSLPTQEMTAESLLQEGNTIASLVDFADAEIFAGKKIYYAIALKSTDPANVKPKIKLSLTCKTGSQQLVDVEYSPEYDFESGITVSDIKVDSETELNATCEVEAQAIPISEDGTAGEMTDWGPVNNFVGMKINHIQYRATMRVLAVNTGAAILRGITTNYRTGEVISTNGYGEIISVIRDWRRDLRHCRVNVKHAPLDESVIKVYGTFRNKSIQVHEEFLGYGEGARAVYPFIHKEGIRLDSVQVYVNGVSATGGFDVNCEAGQININAEQDAIITASYEYGYGAESWLEMEKEYTERFDKYDLSVYTLTIPENESEISTEPEIHSMAGIKVSMSTVSGHVDKEYAGQGTGLMTSYRLAHPVKGGDLKVYADGEILNTSSYVIDDDPRYVRIACEAGSEIRVDYDWESESPIVYEIGGVFSK